MTVSCILVMRIQDYTDNIICKIKPSQTYRHALAISARLLTLRFISYISNYSTWPRSIEIQGDYRQFCVHKYMYNAIKVQLHSKWSKLSLRRDSFPRK